MRFSAYQRFTYTADLYRMEEITDTANGGYRPVFEKEIKIDFFNDPDSVRSMALTEERINGGKFMLKSIKDKNGDAFMGETEYTITRISPVMNVWGNFEYYKLTLAVSEYAIGPRRD